jgi:hypothetical protein
LVEALKMTLVYAEAAVRVGNIPHKDSAAKAVQCACSALAKAGAV